MSTDDALALRLWSGVDMSAGPCGCWPWTLGTNGHGYGQIHTPRPNSKKLGTHRLACSLAHGAAPSGCEPLHSCGNRPCCNPRHLRWGTRKENVADAIAQGTWAHGEGITQAKLTESNVVEIRDRWASGEAQKTIANFFGIHQSHVSQIVNRKAWAHLGH